MTAARFKIHTGLLKAYRSDDGKKRLRTTASSSVKDLQGDTILPEAIKSAAEQARGNLTIFLNHEYKVPEDVLGSTEGAEVLERGLDAEGHPVYDLDLDILVNESNPRANSTFDAIEAGVKLGTSIGALIPKGGATKNKDGSYIIADLLLLEASIVGIPANPRSWVQYAVKALGGLDDMDDESVAEPVIELAVDEPIVEKDEAIEASTIEADVEKDSVTLVSVTVQNQDAQEAPPSGSTPENAVLDETADGDDAALGDDLTRSAEPTEEPESTELDALSLSVTTLSKALTRIGELEKSLVEQKAVNADLNENLTAAMEIINRIKDLPLGRKATFASAVDDFSNRFPMYDKEFRQFLEK